MSYRELAEVLAPTKLASVVRLVRRKGWTKRQSNNGVRIAVPPDFLADVLSRQRRGPSGHGPDASRSKPAKQAIQERPDWANEMASVRADLERERSRADRLEAKLNELLAEAVELRSRADRAEGVAEGLRAAQVQAPAQAPPTQAPPGRVATLYRSLREAFRP